MAELIGSLLYVHAGFMLVGFLSMMAGALAAMFLRSKRWWLRLHKTAGILGVLGVLIGLAAVIFMITLSGGEHFTVTHAYIGAMTATFAAVTPVLGTLQFKIKSHSTKIRIMHRWAGRFTLLFAIITIVTGLRVFGIL
jgi:cytochrome c biogenesis protein ResB